MLPEGSFITSLFERTMPKEVSYYLFFGHKGNRNPFRQNNDGTVTLAAQLDPRSQSEAKLIYGFNVDHTDILLNREVITRYNAILDNIGKKPESKALSFGGKLRVNLSIDKPDGNTLPKPLLMLKLVDKDRNEISLTLTANDTGLEFGPFPGGDYQVSVLADAYKTEPTHVPVTIDPDNIPAVDFSLSPQGLLAGYVGVNLDAGNNPAGIYRAPDDNVKIHLITVSGAGVTRNLVPTQEGEVNFLDLYVSGTDYAHKSVFGFTDLPEGEYELKIEAEGYETYTEKRHVVPGRSNNYRPVRLVPLK